MPNLRYWFCEQYLNYSVAPSHHFGRMGNRSNNSDESHGKNPWQNHSKLIFLVLAWLLSTAFMTTEYEKKLHHKLLSIDAQSTKGVCVYSNVHRSTILIWNQFLSQFSTLIKDYSLPTDEFASSIVLVLQGAFLNEPYDNETEHHLTVVLQSAPHNNTNSSVIMVCLSHVLHTYIPWHFFSFILWYKNKKLYPVR